MKSTIVSPQGNHTTKGTTLKSTQPPHTQKPKTNRRPRSTYRSETHEQLSKQTAWEAHTGKEPITKEPPSEQTRTVASLCLHKPWRRTPRRSLEPLYLATTSLPSQPLMRTHSTSTTRSTLPLDEHQEGPMVQADQVGQEGQTTLMETHTGQLFLPPISSPSNPPETSDQLGYPLSSSTATEPELTPLSESFGFI